MEERAVQLKLAIARPKTKVSLAAERCVLFAIFIILLFSFFINIFYLKKKKKSFILLFSLMSRCEVYAPFDPFVVGIEPSNPWVSDDTAAWDATDKR